MNLGHPADRDPLPLTVALAFGVGWLSIEDGALDGLVLALVGLAVAAFAAHAAPGRPRSLRSLLVRIAVLAAVGLAVAIVLLGPLAASAWHGPLLGSTSLPLWGISRARRLGVSGGAHDAA